MLLLPVKCWLNQSKSLIRLKKSYRVTELTSVETNYKYSPLGKRVVFSHGLVVSVLPAVLEPSKLYDCLAWLVWLLLMVLRAPCQVLLLVQEASPGYMDVAHQFSISGNGCGGKYLLRGFRPCMICDEVNCAKHLGLGKFWYYFIKDEHLITFSLNPLSPKSANWHSKTCCF